MSGHDTYACPVCHERLGCPGYTYRSCPPTCHCDCHNPLLARCCADHREEARQEAMDDREAAAMEDV